MHAFPAGVRRLTCGGCRCMYCVGAHTHGLFVGAAPVVGAAGIQDRSFHAAAGSSYYGQLGTRDVVISPVPVEAAAGRTFQALSAGGWHTCGIDDSGTTMCWGELGFCHVQHLSSANS